MDGIVYPIFLRKSVVHSVKEPIVWLPFLGGVLMLFGVHLPAAVIHAVNLIGNASGGTGLFVVGMMLYGARMAFSAELVTNTVLKNIAQPLLIALIVPLFGVAAISHSRELVLTGAIPVATTSSIMAMRYQKYCGRGNGHSGGQHAVFARYDRGRNCDDALKIACFASQAPRPGSRAVFFSEDFRRSRWRSIVWRKCARSPPIDGKNAPASRRRR